MQTNLLARLLAVARTVTPLSPVSPAGLSLNQLAPGQTVRAEVAARLADGTFRVVTGEQALKLALPAGARVGDVVTLRLIAREPRLALEVDSEPAEARPRLSGTARLIDRILHGTRDAQLPAARPVTATPVSDGRALSAPLARAIEASGLFYESHQARWIDGGYPLTRLLDEPQARLARTHGQAEQDAARSHGEAAGDDASGAAGEETPPEAHEPLREPQRRAPAEPAAAAARAPAAALPATDGEEPAASATAYALPAAPAPADSADEGVRNAVLREILPIVRQQLETFESRQIVWQGELWPGQAMRWEIGEEPAGAREPPDAHVWRTRLALRLPVLGGIDAELSFGAQGVRVAVEAEDRPSAEALRARGAELFQALERAGLRVASVEIRHGGR